MANEKAVSKSKFNRFDEVRTPDGSVGRIDDVSRDGDDWEYYIAPCDVERIGPWRESDLTKVDPKRAVLYLELFHGRKPKDAQLDDWGAPGPVFGPFDYFHTTYACEIKFGEDGRNILGINDAMIYYDGMWYGDWSVFSESVLKGENGVRARLQTFDSAKAAFPVEKEANRLIKLRAILNALIDEYVEERRKELQR